MNTRQIIDYATDDNAKEMREALYASIYDRVSNAIEAKKQEIAHNMLGMPLSTEDVQLEAKDEDEKEDEKEGESKETEHEEDEDEKEDKAMIKKMVKKDALK